MLPTVYQSRSAISIYDAQFSGLSGSRKSIPTETISDIISALQSFVKTCQAFKVPHENIRILATEATRTAPNSVEFREQIKAVTGLGVELLSKEDEGRIGALGIASSFPAPLKGVVLDLGGGSVQISWVNMAVSGELQRSKSTVSMPFGAAAMMGRLNSGTKASDLSQEIESAFRNALQELDLPNDIHDPAADGITLYLSGGGFRGWGYTLMERHTIQLYPIPIINGFGISADAFHPQGVLAREFAHQDAQSTSEQRISNPITDDEFRISARRASQAPAVALLIDSLLTVLPKVSTVYFAQGGVREGSLYSLLPADLQSQHPLIAATQPFALPGAERLAEIIQNSIPQSSTTRLPSFLDLAYSRKAFTTALANLLAYHGSCPKDIRASAALRSTTTGILAATHGLTHESRAWLALALLGRWGASREDLPKTDTQFYDGLSMLIGAEAAWWAGYVGRVAGIVGAAFPAGCSEGNDINQLKCSAGWDDTGKRSVISLSADFDEDENVRKALKLLVKWGKKKKWSARLVQGYKVIVSGINEESSD